MPVAELHVKELLVSFSLTIFTLMGFRGLLQVKVYFFESSSPCLKVDILWNSWAFSCFQVL